MSPASRYMSSALSIWPPIQDTVHGILQTAAVQALQLRSQLHQDSKEVASATLKMSCNTSEKATEFPAFPDSAAASSLGDSAPPSVHTLTAKLEQLEDSIEPGSLKIALKEVQDLVVGYETEFQNLRAQNKNLQEDMKQMLDRMGCLEANVVHRTDILHDGISMVLKNTDAIHAAVATSKSTPQPGNSPRNKLQDFRSPMPFKCYPCNVSFLDQQRLDTHLKKACPHKRTSQTGGPASRLTCAVCKEQFRSHPELSTHLQKLGHRMPPKQPKNAASARGAKKNNDQKESGGDAARAEPGAEGENLIEI